MTAGNAERRLSIDGTTDVMIVKGLHAKFARFVIVKPNLTNKGS